MSLVLNIYDFLVQSAAKLRFLCQYLSIIDESYARLFDIYNELENKKSEMTLTNQGQSLNMTGSKKVVS